MSSAVPLMAAQKAIGRCMRFAAIGEEMHITVDVGSIADEILVDDKAVYALARRKSDPLPLMVLRGKRRGAFAFVSDLEEWLRRNSVPFADARCYAHEDMRGREV